MPQENAIPLKGPTPVPEKPAQKPPEAPKSPPKEVEDEPISLVEETETIGASVRAIGSVLSAEKKAQFKRPLNLTGQGATRCRVFHSKIAMAPLENLEQTINEWLDSEKIEIKHVGHIIGTMEGKRPEPNLLVIVWY